ncbi:MAG: carboxypeptidase regulatory-like domain-containing protein [Terriglobales bacterium]
MVSLLTLCMMFSAFAVAQSTTTGAIGGVVTDQSGAVVPGATIEVRNAGTNASANTTSDGAGRFRVVNLQPGTYNVKVTASGFGVTASVVVVEVGLVTSVETKMNVAGRGETVEVTGEAPAINVDQPDFSTNVNQTSINELPINGRRWSNFALLTPGATPDGNFGLISFRGISGLLNNSTVDGGDNNQAFFSEERGRTRISYVISQSAIREFQVNTSNFSAEYGRSAGGVVNAVTKSGTNALHGSAFWYVRDNTLGAFNSFSRLNGVPIKPEDRRDQFGGTIGGPIVKDRLFFFFSYDQQKRNFPGLGLPSSTAFLAPFSASEINTMTTRGLTPAQQAAGLAYLASLTGVVPRKGDQTLFLPKIDWRITDRNSLALSYNRLRWDSPAGIQTQPVVTRGIASFGNDGVKVDSVTGKLTTLVTNSISNEFRFQWGRDFEFQSSQTPAPGEPTTGPGGRPPSVFPGTGGFTFGKPNFLERKKYPLETRIQVADSIVWSKGKHTFKAGLDINHVNDVLDNLFQEGGAYSFGNRVDFISDFTNAAGRLCRSSATATPPNAPIPCWSSFNQGFGPTAFEFSTVDYNFFLQDDWRVHPRVTLNLGVRYEYTTLPPPQIPNPLLPASSVFPNDRNNIGPRVGVAWDMYGDGRTALRGGYGIYYGRIINSTISNAITNTGMATGQLQFFVQPTAANAPLYPNVLPAAPVSGSSRPDVVVFGADGQVPAIHQFDLVFEHQIGKSNVFSVSYLGSQGRNLPNFVDRNLPATMTGAATNYRVIGGDFSGQVFAYPFFSGARPNASLGRVTTIETNVRTNYNALVAQFNRRLTNGLQFQNSYTWAKALDNGQNSQTFTTGNAVLNPLNSLDAEYARSNFDIRHRFVSSIVWQPNYFKTWNPFARALLSDFTIAPVIALSSGRSYTGFISGGPTGTTAGGIFGAGGSSRVPFMQRNEFNQPRTANVDLRISRRFKFGEVAKLELLGEAFNLFNHVNVTDVNNTQYNFATTTAANTAPGACSAQGNAAFAGVPSGTRVLCAVPSFGVASAAGNTVFRERQVQFAIRFEF